MHVYMHSVTVPAAAQPMESTEAALTSRLIHKMGSGVQIVKWLLCGFHMQSVLFIYELMAPLVAAMEPCTMMLLVIVGEERR